MKKLLTLLLIVTYSISTNAQEVGSNYIPPSPNASSLLKFANIPVNLYTGVANINVPLFTLPGGDINIPVSLNYHASGIKVREMASSYGLGWSLIGAGAVTRIVRGLPDEEGYSSRPGSWLHREEYNSLANGFIDSEPDMFYFNFLGNAGKFVIDADGNASCRRG